MHRLQRPSHWLISTIFHTVVRIICFFYNMKLYEEKVAAWRKYPEGTVGRDVARCLDDNKLRLVPHFESHDLKHVLLGYKMTPVDEIRLQAFMLGNGNRTIASCIIFAFGLLLPDAWPSFVREFKRGRRAIPISSWTIEALADQPTLLLQQQIFNNQYVAKPVFNMKAITTVGAVTAIVAGLFGMLFCLPFLFSSNVADLIGAGFPLVAGAIMLAGGLMTLGNLARNSKDVATNSSTPLTTGFH
jgi:hypothetical protein